MKRSKILILSRADDSHVERMMHELDQLGSPWVLFDPGAFPHSIEFTTRSDHQRFQSQLILPEGQFLDFDEIGAVWYRRPTPIHADIQLPEMQQTFIEREARAGLWGMLRSIEGLWVNYPDAIRTAAYKPRQLTRACQLGLSVPRTLLTNRPDDFKRFYEECDGNVIYKLLGFPSYEVENGALVSTYTSKVPESLLQETHRIKATAHLFQEYQPKICDLRVVVIGSQLFAVEIHPLSEETRLDFRRDYRALRYAVHELPTEIRQKLLALTQTYRLNYAALDLLYTVEKRYVFLELNPVGQLGWLEEPTGLPLLSTLARFLAGIPAEQPK